MYLHIVMLAFGADAGPAFLERVEGHAARIRAECAGVRFYHFGRNESARARGYTHAVLSAFDDAAAHDAYQASPAHQAMKRDMAPHIQRMAVHDGPAPDGA